jgi:hypothetical protein
MRVRCVRGGSAAAAATPQRFVPSPGGGHAFDRLTGLRWQLVPFAALVLWDTDLAMACSDNEPGQTGGPWRTPTAYELRTLVQPMALPATYGPFVASASVANFTTDGAGIVLLQNGLHTQGPVAATLRCVR